MPENLSHASVQQTQLGGVFLPMRKPLLFTPTSFLLTRVSVQDGTESLRELAIGQKPQRENGEDLLKQGPPHSRPDPPEDPPGAALPSCRTDTWR